MTPKTDSASAQPALARKPRLSLSIATVFGLGYLPKAPGTFGSIAGAALVLAPFFLSTLCALIWGSIFVGVVGQPGQLLMDPILGIHLTIAIVVAALGVYTAGRAARWIGTPDPQNVVIDEVSGQQLTLIIGLALPGIWHAAPHPGDYPLSIITMHSVLNWKYLLLGFILFRVFDIWKPFPVRLAESLPGGWGIMADDWVAAIYASIGVWLARAAGL